MAKFFKLFKIFLLYGLTAPTNVMCLGAFTEFWLKNTQLTRLDLANSYLLSTICVFFALQLQKYFESSIDIKLCFGVLAINFIVLGFGHFSFILSIFLFFFFVQWIGQGLIVEECRVLLANTAQHYSSAAGCLEAWGTFLVYSLPFVFLCILKKCTWPFLLTTLGIIYAIIAFVLDKNRIKTPKSKLFWEIWKNKYFITANCIIYLPVFLTSGFFFHLEAFVEHYQLSTKQLEMCILPQIFTSIVLQMLFGVFVEDKQKRLTKMYALLFISQILWLITLLFIRGPLFCWLYILTGAIGWGCFGLLVNIAWKFIFKQDPAWTEACLRNSVNFGFLANAMGPLVFTLFLK